METIYFLTGQPLSDIGIQCGQFAALGVGLGLVFWTMGYIVWFVIDLLKGGVL